MKVYLVGGAVRDKILGLAVTENDYVVVGSTPGELESQGYLKVGKDFPVFLHPKTKEEYALARTEKKTAKGYYGFDCDFSTTVTLEEDLMRRDLTINAIAEDEDGNIIDPYNGQTDINNKVLRHISDAFSEDPLRVLRVARFKAKLNHLGFSIAPETKELMSQITESGELEYLTKERVWLEINKALKEQSPAEFFKTLHECGALKVLIPELDRLWGVPQSPKYHPEIDTGIHAMMAIEQSALLTDNTEVRFAVVCHDLGKGTTPKNVLPRHIGHDVRGVNLIKSVCKRFNIPKSYMDLACLVSKYHIQFYGLLEDIKGTPKICMNILEGLDAFRKPDRVKQFVLACLADTKGRKGSELKLDNFEPDALANLRAEALAGFDRGKFLLESHAVAQKISIDSIDKSLSGNKIGDAIKQLRIKKITELQQTKFS